MSAPRIRLTALLVLLAGSLACSPEAARSRDGGPGADVGNHGSPPEIHGKLDPSRGEPLVGRAVTATR